MRRAALVLAAAVVVSARTGFSTTAETWVGPASGLWMDAGSWSGGVVPNNVPGGETYGVTIGSAGVALAAPVAVDAVTLQGGTLTLGSTLTLAGAVVNNTGRIVVGAGGMLAGAGDLYLLGSGTVSLADAGASVRSAGGGRVSNYETVAGIGTLGGTGTSFTNAGTVSADGGWLTVAASLGAGGDHVNSGFMRATAGGTLSLGGTLTNAGGTVEAGTGSVVDVHAWVTGGVVRAVAGGSVTLSDGGLNGVAMSGASFVSGPLGLSGGIAQTGVMTVAGGSSLLLQSDTTLSGGGSLVLGGGLTFSGIASNLKLTTDQVISGSGAFNNLLLNNSGTISATAGGMYLSLATTGPSVNTGVVRANGGVSSFVQFQNSTATLNNTGGVIEATNGSTAYLAGTITGGIVRSAGTGRLQVQSVTTLAGVTLAGQATVSTALQLSNVSTSALLTTTAGSIGVSGNIVNTGTMQFFSGTRLMLSGDTVLSGGGAILFPTNSGGGVSAASSQYRLTTDNVIAGYGLWNNVNLSNSGTITSSGTLGTGSLGITFPSTGSLTNFNTGLLRATNGTLVLAGFGATLSNYTGVIEALNGATVAINNLTVAGGTLKTSATGTLTLQSGTLQSVSMAGNMSVSSFVQLMGLSSNTGVMTIASFGSLGLAGSLANTGTIQLTANGARLMTIGDSTLSGRGTILMGANTVIGGFSAARLTTDQFISAASSGSLTNCLLVNTGTISAGAGMLTLSLPSSYNGTLSSSNSGVIRANGGTLTLNNNFAILDNTGGVLEALDNSVLNLGGTITGGTVRSFSTGTVGLTNAVLANLTLGANARLNTGSVGLAGAINQTGTLTVADFTSVRLIADTTLSGHGSIVLGAAGSLLTATNSTMRFTSDNVITGQGSLTNMGMASSGTITATAGTLTIAPTAQGGLANTGILRANGGVLLLQTVGGGTLTNAGGVIEAQPGSRVSMNGFAEVVGGTVRALGDGTVTLDSLGTVFNSVAFGGLVDLQTTTGLRNQATNTGTMWVMPGATLRLMSDVTLTGGGTLGLGASNVDADASAPNARLTSVDNVLYGYGNLKAPLTNFGTLTASFGAMVLNPPTQAGTTATISTGTLQADNGTVQFETGTHYLSGVVRAMNQGALLFAKGTGVISSPVTMTNGAAAFASTGNSATTISGVGTVTVGATGALTADNVSVTTLQVDGALTLRNTAPGTASKVSLLVPSGTIQMFSNTLILQTTPAGQIPAGPSSQAGKAATLADLAGRITAGSITSSAAGNLVLALVDNADLHLAAFKGQAVDDTYVFMTPALMGDANIDGSVDLGDFNAWFAHVGANSWSVTQGDFDRSGVVDLGDFNAWFSHVGATVPVVAASPLALAVPEPGTLAALGLPWVLLAGGARRRAGGGRGYR